MNYKKIHDILISRARNRIYDNKKHHNHHIIPTHEDPNSKETVPLTFKEHMIIHHLRWKITGTRGNEAAYKIFKGMKEEAHKIWASIGGKIGGKQTKKRKSGIFSENFDRAKEAKRRWDIGIFYYDYERMKNNGIFAGKNSVENKLGIFKEENQIFRKDWAKLGALALMESGNINGICSKEWRNLNKDLIKIFASNAGKIGGKKVGSMFWWNNGIINKKSEFCPGENFVRGQLMSEKKKKSVEINFNLKGKYYE